MKAIALGAFGAALLASAASAAPLNATTIGSAEVSNVDQVGLVCNEYYGRCWRTRGPRYVLRYYYDPSYFPGRGYNYYAGPGYYNRPATADQGSSFAAGSKDAKGRSLVRPLLTDSRFQAACRRRQRGSSRPRSSSRRCRKGKLQSRG